GGAAHKKVIVKYRGTFHLVSLCYFRDRRHGFQRRAFEISHMQVVTVRHVDTDNALVRSFPFIDLFLGYTAVVGLSLRLFRFVIFHMLLLLKSATILPIRYATERVRVPLPVPCRPLSICGCFPKTARCGFCPF